MFLSQITVNFIEILSTVEKTKVVNVNKYGHPLLDNDVNFCLLFLKIYREMLSEFENLSLGGNNAASNHGDPFTHTGS